MSKRDTETKRHPIRLILIVALVAFNGWYFLVHESPIARIREWIAGPSDPILRLPVYRDYAEDYFWLNKARKGPTEIVFVGDSITRRFNVAEHFPERSILNRGIFFDSTVGLLNRLDRNVTNLDVPKVFLLIGANDLAYRGDDEIVDSISRILTRLKPRKVYLQSILPMAGQRKALNPRIRAINERLRGLCDGTQTVFLDLHRSFASGDGVMKSTLTTDGVHPNAAGYRLWAELIREHVEQPATRPR